MSEKREKTQISIIRDERGDITTYTSEIQIIIRICFENWCSNKLENLEVINFLDTNDLSKLNQKDIGSLNRPISSNESETEIKSFPTKKISGSDGFFSKF